MPLLKDYLDKFCPTVVSMANLSNAEWQSISDRFDARMNRIVEALDTTTSIGVQTTIYDLVLLADSGQKEGISFLRFIERLSKDLIKDVPARFHVRLRNSFVNLVSNFDDARSGYLDPIGEFTALLSMVTESTLELKEIEATLPSGKKADFCFVDSKGDRLVWVEVLNIHFQEGKIRTDNDLLTFLSKRIEDKLQKKLHALGCEAPNRIFALLPVVWCELEDVQDRAEVILRVKQKYRTLPICLIAQTRSDSGEVGYRFTTMDHALRYSGTQSASDGSGGGT